MSIVFDNGSHEHFVLDLLHKAFRVGSEFATDGLNKRCMMFRKRYMDFAVAVVAVGHLTYLLKTGKRAVPPILARMLQHNPEQSQAAFRCFGGINAEHRHLFKRNIDIVEEATNHSVSVPCGDTHAFSGTKEARIRRAALDFNVREITEKLFTQQPIQLNEDQRQTLTNYAVAVNVTEWSLRRKFETLMYIFVVLHAMSAIPNTQPLERDKMFQAIVRVDADV